MHMLLGTGNRQRYINANTFYQTLGQNALTGCDFTLMRRCTSYTNVIREFAKLPHCDVDRLLNKVEEFICRIYEFKSNVYAASIAVFTKTYGIQKGLVNLNNMRRFFLRLERSLENNFYVLHILPRSGELMNFFQLNMDGKKKMESTFLNGLKEINSLGRMNLYAQK